MLKKSIWEKFKQPLSIFLNFIYCQIVYLIETIANHVADFDTKYNKTRE
jgi:hypothetical protein